jgi:hypothetical protein
VRAAALAEHARHRPRVRVLVDVRPAHVEGLAATGAEEKQELDRAGNDEPRDLLAVLEDGVDFAGCEIAEGQPRRLDLLVGEDPLARPLGAEALQASGRIALDQLLAQAPAEGGSDQGENAVCADRRPAGDPLQERPQLAVGELSRGLRADRGALDRGLESSPVVAVRGGASVSLAGVDVLLHERRYREGLSRLALARGRVVPECGVAEGLARELAGVSERQRGQRT